MNISYFFPESSTTHIIHIAITLCRIFHSRIRLHNRIQNVNKTENFPSNFHHFNQLLDKHNTRDKDKECDRIFVFAHLKMARFQTVKNVWQFEFSEHAKDAVCCFHFCFCFGRHSMRTNLIKWIYQEWVYFKGLKVYR